MGLRGISSKANMLLNSYIFIEYVLLDSGHCIRSVKLNMKQHP